jgi:hypothetical protein
VERLEAENRQLRELVANTGTGFNRSRTPQSRDSRNWGDNSNAIARATLREEASAPGDSEALPDEMVSRVQACLGKGPLKGASLCMTDLCRILPRRQMPLLAVHLSTSVHRFLISLRENSSCSI